LKHLYSLISQFLYLLTERNVRRNLNSVYQNIVGIRAGNNSIEFGDSRHNNRDKSLQKILVTSFFEYEKGNFDRATEIWLETVGAKKKELGAIGFSKANVKILGAGFNQIGHLAGGLGTRAMLKKMKLTNDNYIYLCDGQTNSFYANLFGSYFPVINLQPSELSIITRTLWPINEDVYTVDTKKGTLDFLSAHNYALKEFNLDESVSPLLELTAEQIDLGWECLKRYGINEKSWFITLHVRENNNDPHSKSYARNADPYTYLTMIDFIRSLGGFVIRIGNKNMTALPRISGLIDLTREKTSEILDIFALSQCRFMVGTNSGPSAVPSTFGIPVLITNAVALGKIAYFPNSFSIPKIVNTRSGTSIPFSRVLNSALGGLDSYLENWDQFETGMSWRNNTEDEILNGAIEMLRPAGLKLTSDQVNIVNNIVPKFTNETMPISEYFILKHYNLFEEIIH